MLYKIMPGEGHCVRHNLYEDAAASKYHDPADDGRGLANLRYLIHPLLGPINMANRSVGVWNPH